MTLLILGSVQIIHSSIEEDAQEKAIDVLAKNVSLLKDKVEKLEKENTLLREGPLSWMIVATPETSHPSVRAFRDKVQSSLSTFFGRKKLGIEDDEDTLIMLGLDLAQEAGGYIPVPGVSTAINAMIKIGQIAYKHLNSAPTISFTSFAEIDKLSFLIAEGIAAIYSPQIQELNQSQARVLADSAHDSLKSFLERAQKRGKTVITPEQLILVLGKYHLGKLRTPNVFSRNPLSRAVLLGNIKGEDWYDMEVFLGSGINAEVETGKRYKFISQSSRACYYSAGSSGLVYIRYKDVSGKYGNRIGTNEYAKALNFLQKEEEIDFVPPPLLPLQTVESTDTFQEGILTEEH